MKLSLFLRYLASLFLGGLLLLGTQVAGARELAAEPEDMVEVEIATVGVAGFGGPPVVLLREPGTQDVIPIFIGPNEAAAILHGLGGERSRRPMTHELLGDVLSGIEVTLERIYVDAIVDHTFLGMLELRVEGWDEPVRIDSRPSDAIALALYAGASIHVAPQVLEAARQIEYEGLDDQVVAALGITVTPADDDLREALSLPDREGVLVSDTRGPAAEAGMEPGALILEVNGEVPTTPMQFLELVRDTPRGEDARLRYWQEGEEHEIELSTDVPPPRAVPRERLEEPGIQA
ncbi:bifunctional nuclease family protein [Halomonas sp. ANAO-440]|uniref:bifunctional nuclease domain-containing protein n=1 Tax=Halomonas sp. ANAO-440 TaxID=2861360 RepID=UPI001CAA6EB9|nr:bifunctional nuclease domain-containing protein [Halomonas sp. ANAO-440]MBZ0329816.1 bifunctional nuclease family protein [Halomonas sp. ANAO-440]